MKYKNKSKFLIIFSIIFFILFLIFFIVTRPNNSDYFNKKTYIIDENLGIKVDVSNMKLEEASNKVKEQFDNLDFILIQNNKEVDTIKFKDFNFNTNINTEMEKSKELNDTYHGFDKFKKHFINLHIMYDIENKNIENLLNNLNCIKNYKENKDAYLTIKNNEMVIVDEEYGTEIDKNSLINIIIKKLKSYEKQIDLDKEDVYIKPSILKSNANLKENVEKYNKCVNTKITYVFGDSKEEVSKEMISTWISLENNELVIDEDAILSYIQSLAKKYNTFGTNRMFTTTSGKKIKIPAGDYGWAISQTKEAQALKEDILNGNNKEKEPIWLYCGYGKYYNDGQSDINNSYVEIDISTQHLWLYVNGELKVETDFVSGNESNGNGTPSGVFGITYKTRNATLRGQGYNTKVSYWMPFNKNIGMHDASWRNSFGGCIYKTNGSHGCINLPPNKAKEIYSYLDTFFPIIVYDSTELNT